MQLAAGVLPNQVLLLRHCLVFRDHPIRQNELNECIHHLMDPGLLSLLPDAAKLTILRQLGQLDVADHREKRLQHDLQEEPAAGLRSAIPAAGSSCPGTVPPLLAHCKLTGGLAIVDGFLSTAEVKVSRSISIAKSVGQQRQLAVRNARRVAAAPCAHRPEPPLHCMMQAAQLEAKRVLQANARTAGMVTAGEGRQWASSSMRGDRTAWLSTDALLASGHRQLAALVQRLLALQPWLQHQGYDVGGRVTCQLACYPGGGTRYVRHRDASATVPHRTVTALCYLNPGAYRLQ